MINDQELRKGLLPLRLIWFAMIVSLAIYLFIGLYAGANFPSSMDGDTFSRLRTILYVVAFATLVAIRFIRKLILSAKGLNRQPAQGSQPPELQKYYTAVVVSLALSESIGIYGLLLFFLGKNPTDLYLLILVSAAAMFMYRPKMEEVIELVTESREGTGTGEGKTYPGVHDQR